MLSERGDVVTRRFTLESSQFDREERDHILGSIDTMILHQSRSIEDRIIQNNFGTHLLKKLFNGSIDRIANLAREQPRNGVVILEIDSKNPELLSYPWECCAYPNWAELGQRKPNFKIAVIRNSGDRIPSFEYSEPIKLLVAGVNARGVSVPNYVRELSNIKGGLNNLEDERYQIHEMNKNVTIDRLRSMISREKPNILHLVAHGSSGTASLQSSTGRTSGISGQQMSYALSAAKNELALFLSTACLSFRTGDSNDRGFGDTISNIVPTSIGMQFAIDDPEAEDFSASFYYYLSHSNSILSSYIGARDQLYEPPGYGASWIAPVFYRRIDRYQPQFLFPEDRITPLIKKFAYSLESLLIDLSSKDATREEWNKLHGEFSNIERELMIPISLNKLDLSTRSKKIYNKTTRKTFRKLQERIDKISVLFTEEKNDDYLKYDGFLDTTYVKDNLPTLINALSDMANG